MRQDSKNMRSCCGLGSAQDPSGLACRLGASWKRSEGQRTWMRSFRISWRRLSWQPW